MLWGRFFPLFFFITQYAQHPAKYSSIVPFANGSSKNKNRESKQIFSWNQKIEWWQKTKLLQQVNKVHFSIKIFLVPKKTNLNWGKKYAFKKIVPRIIYGSACCSCAAKMKNRRKKRTKDNTFLISRLTGKVVPTIHPAGAVACNRKLVRMMLAHNATE